MVFCNIATYDGSIIDNDGHNPYFNRWFSAIELKEMENHLKN